MAAATQPRARRTWPTGAVGAILFVACLGVYLGNGRVVPFRMSGDTLPARLLPFSALSYGTSTLDPFAHDFAARGGFRWYVRVQREHLISFYPIGPALAALPVYVPIWGWLTATGRSSHSDFFDASPVAEKLAASGIAALAVVLLWLVVRRRFSARAALWTALAFAFGTEMWAVASQMLWQHGPVVLGILAGVFFLERDRPSSIHLGLSGAAFSLAVACRPTAAFFLVAAVGAQLIQATTWRDRLRRVSWMSAGAAPLLLLVGVYNLYWYDSMLGGYALGASDFDWRRLPAGGAGLLFSPNRGLLVFTPIALVGVLGIAMSLRRMREWPLLPFLAAAALANFLLLSAWGTWAGGWCFGPRYLTDLLPILALGAPLAIPRLPRWTRPLMVVMLVWSVLVQWSGAFCYPASNWSGRMGDRLQESAWDVGHLELWDDLKTWRQMGVWAAPY